jgi:ubiquinone/menaquinone biosynthesis C-methylase UbiE
MTEYMDIKTHYDMLIEENNDPFRDPAVLQKYMESWDGQAFLDLMELDKSKTVLEIGIGTGRLAVKVAGSCQHLTGIDISSKTIERAKENLCHCLNISLICDDFLNHHFNEFFDVIYSSLTMMHFKEKQLVYEKIKSLLNDKGRFCLSIDKNQSEWIDMGNRKIRIYPDTLEKTIVTAELAGLKAEKTVEIENAYLIVFQKEK